MLKLYGARESADKERFIYEHIEGRTLVIVPNQYTLIAEEQALKYLGGACLFDVEILSMNRLGLRLLRERALEGVPVLDKYGRFMLLSKIISDHSDSFDVFGRVADKKTYIEMINDFIADFKQQDCSSAEIREMLASDEAGDILRGKLAELDIILSEYEKAVEGKYTDTEDYISMYTDAASGSEYLRGKSIWIYGFDSVTGRFADTVAELSANAADVNFVLNESDFGLEEALAARLSEKAGERGVSVSRDEIGSDFALEKSSAIRYIEKNLFDRSGRYASPGDAVQPDGLTMVECANPYYEAETAAVYIHHLLRDEGYRMKDIAVICNNEDTRQPIIKRTFEEYGIPLFVDARRGISDSQIAGFLVNQLSFLSNGYRSSAMLAMLKSGLSGYETGRIEELENYVSNYSIKGSMWTSPFKYGSFEYDDEIFADMEELRSDIMSRMHMLEDLISGAESIGGFISSYRLYLDSEWNIREKLERIAEDRIDDGMTEAAEWTAQSYGAVTNILDQITQILGDSEMDLDTFETLFSEGLENIEIGMIPPALDGITMGTMIRTRTGDVKAVVILGANEGELPLEPAPEGLFSVDEKAFFAERGFALGGLDDIKMTEENVAMYRMVSKPSEKLFISYTMSDEAGNDKRPSPLIDSIKALFPGIRVGKDTVSGGFDMALIDDRHEALRHLMNHLKERESTAPAPGSADPDMLAHCLLTWYEENEPAMLDAAMKAGMNDNKADPIDRELAKKLFARNGGEFSFSASRLEKYYRCPFRHFVLYGLAPKEEREFRSSGREIGDVYHECIMRVSQRLMREASSQRNADIVSGGCSDEAIAEMVGEELSAISEKYRGGLFVSAGREEYRLSRIREICSEAVRALAEQLQKGAVREAFFEEPFGRGCRFEPITFSLGGDKIYIEGKIDRIDILGGGDIRIIDYKTGKDSLDPEQMRCGYKMQLMVYMEGASGDSYEPAGMFYFNISDSQISANDRSAAKQETDLEKESDERFRLNGAYVNEERVVSEMPAGVIGRKSIPMTREEFAGYEDDVRRSIESISEGIISGDIAISPTVLRNDRKATECRYCDYRSICRFDLTYRGNRYRKV